jgi:glycosyltransferase involved in cell wall biosynthesis
MPRSEDPLVLIVFSGESVGGAEMVILRLLPALEERGWRFLFWVPSPSALRDELAARGYEVHGAPRPVTGFSLAALRTEPGLRRRAARAPRYLAGLRRLIRERRPALVHANSIYNAPEAALAKAAGARVLLYVHEILQDSRKGRLAPRIGLAASDTVVACSRAAGAAFARSPKLRIVYGGVQAPEQAPDHPADPGPMVVGSVGVIARRKGTDVLLEAARLVRDETEAIEFRLVGAASEPLDRAWAEALLADLPPGVGHVPRADVERELAGWSALAIASRVDPFPTVVLEAMAAGLPIVGTKVGGIGEQVGAEGGVLVEPEDPRALADALLELKRDPERRLALGAAARARVIREFPLERQVAGLHDAYEATLVKR